ncbi:hypothetical protein GGI07_003246 [Coemansia sp. Benny D115]|nr:hypothetical protein GGI07_003246 [Coemansia sp. Benny D115]
MVPPKPYWNGRFSSGPIWAEYFALLQGAKLQSYAVGAAVTSNSNLKLFGFLPMSIPSTKDQISQFVSNNPNYKTKSVNGDLAVLEIGGNDIMTVLPDVVSGKTSTADFAEILSNTVVSQVQTLKDAGFKTILVSNSPSMQYVPLMRYEDRVQQVGSISQAYNTKLSSKLSSWGQQSNVLLGMLDFDQFMTTSLSKSVTSAIGVTDTTNSCVGGNALSLFTSHNHCEALIRFAMDIKGTLLCSNPSKNYFWDPIHPGERVHRLFGYYANEFFNSLKAGNSSGLYKPSASNLLKLVSKYGLNSDAPKPVRI